jgi:hypothetical protein
VAYLVVPVFGFANAGVALGQVGLAELTAPATLGASLGLFLGKPIGVGLFCLAAIKLGWAQRPSGASWTQLFGVSALCGIGFTMSLFINNLAFDADPAGRDQDRRADRLAAVGPAGLADLQPGAAPARPPHFVRSLIQEPVMRAALVSRRPAAGRGPARPRRPGRFDGQGLHRPGPGRQGRRDREARPRHPDRRTAPDRRTTDAAAPGGGVLTLVIDDARPNRPTPQQLMTTQGLSMESFGVGGARISGDYVDPAGKRTPIAYSWYETDIRWAPTVRPGTTPKTPSTVWRFVWPRTSSSRKR